MVKELSKLEKFYIENNTEKKDSEIAAELPGVGAKTVAKYRESLPKKEEEVDVKHTTETREERIDRLGNGPQTGDFIARQEGISIMTEQASEVADARAIVHGNSMSKKEFEKSNRNKIHRPKG